MIVDDAIFSILPLIVWFPIANLVPASMGWVVGVIGMWLYFALMDSSKWQATLGKRVMGIKVVDKYGRRLGFGRATWRYFSEVVVMVVLFIVCWIGSRIFHDANGDVGFGLFMIGLVLVWLVWAATYLMVNWTEREQSLYDMMAGTLIVLNGVKPDQPLPAKRMPIPRYGGWIVLISLLASMGLSGYQSYRQSSIQQVKMAAFQTKVSEAITAAEIIKTQMTRQECPSGNLPSPSPLIGTVSVEKTGSGRCAITLTLGKELVNAFGNNGRIEFTTTNKENNSWTCSSTLPDKYLPDNCRGSVVVQQQ